MSNRIQFENKVSTPEDFIVVYLNNIRGMLGNISGNALKLLQLMWIDSEFPERSNRVQTDRPKLVANAVRTTGEFKEAWAQELKLSIGAVNNLVTILIKQGILIEYQSPVYYLDPKRFFKGSAEQRRTAVEVIFKYEIKEGI